MHIRENVSHEVYLSYNRKYIWHYLGRVFSFFSFSFFCSYRNELHYGKWGYREKRKSYENNFFIMRLFYDMFWSLFILNLFLDIWNNDVLKNKFSSFSQLYFILDVFTWEILSQVEVCDILATKLTSHCYTTKKKNIWINKSQH